MNKSFAKRVLFGIAALALPSAMAHAADGPTYYVGGAMLGALDSTKSVTHSTMGLAITGGAEFRSTEGSYAFRPGLAIYSLPGKAKDGVKTSLTDFQFYGDIVFPSGIKDVSFIGGLSVQRWYYKTTADAGTASPLQLDSKGFNPGAKLGVRLGIEYQITPKLNAEVLFQQTDFGGLGADAKGNTDPSTGALINGDNVFPSWIQVGVKYKF